jgi:Protein of unknown function (DUF3617)
MRASTFLMAVALLNSASAWAQVTIRPGQYEFTIDMKMAVPKEAQKAVLDAAGFNRQQKRLECITPDQAKQAKDDVVKFAQREMDVSSCTMSNVKSSATTLTFNMTCKEDNVAMTGTAEFTFAGDSFTSLGTMKSPEGTSTVKTVAKRVGDCK